jgi:hypothetical protein
MGLKPGDEVRLSFKASAVHVMADGEPLPKAIGSFTPPGK